ncbi:aminoglycoside phosphotransferase family protein [Pseudoalteromonas arctica]|uniref:Aminoglycoside phosphotransferase family protein n=1 Tax=Pseudoalteromonas arctica TaxID=394751 RepID=A0AAP7CK97_9GAMM|nr:aminoglycoside phosphotransferase family protein [Pseudoalteromonas arctica]NMP04129.1 aminoglycoside phosphotransferase family protein [Pseudoalteromonas arctica]
MNISIQNKLSGQLALNPELTQVSVIGSGHINSTWLLTCIDKQFIVQKLNTEVFKYPAQLVNNAKLIEQHLNTKQLQSNYPLETVKHIAIQNNEHLIEIDSTHYRVLNYISDSYSEDVVKNAQQSEQAAYAFGVFTHALQDFDAQQLHTVIPDFHNLAMRFEQLNTAITNNSVNRVKHCADEIEYCLSQQHLITELNSIAKQIPLRVCHNDTKINNMLFCSATHKAKAVIDLDTCMAGFRLYDFGDIVRTFCSPEAEDSTNLHNVIIRKDIFSAIVKGYVTPLKSSMSTKEQESLLLGAKIMPLMLSVRFLTDYLNNDVYFKVAHAEHNLERAQNQLALYKNILSNEKWMHQCLMS